jgi:hypothetical protein
VASLLVDPAGLRVGPTLLSETWFANTSACYADIWCDSGVLTVNVAGLTYLGVLGSSPLYLSLTPTDSVPTSGWSWIPVVSMRSSVGPALPDYTLAARWSGSVNDLRLFLFQTSTRAVQSTPATGTWEASVVLHRVKTGVQYKRVMA